MNISTINKHCAGRQFSASNPPQRKSANVSGNFKRQTMTRWTILLILTAFLLLEQQSSGQTNNGQVTTDSLNKKKSKPKFGGLNGDVKQVFEETYTAEYKLGQIVAGTKLDETDKRIRLEIFDKNGNCIRKNAYGLDNKIKTFSISEFDILNCGKRTRYYCCDSIFKSWIANECDKNGNDIGAIQYKADSTIMRQYKWKRDENGRLIETLEYKADSLIKKTTYKYDTYGNEIECNIYDSKGNLEGIYKTEYDSVGNKIEKKIYSKDKLFNTKRFKYDSKESIIDEVTYDSNNKILDKTTYTYEYDKQNNWIKRIEFVSSEPKFITRRKIVYN